jgi:anaerobic ribonucleoside-triphosphate reductase activating protein
VKLKLHAFEPRSRANGPGVRAVVWFQGCTLGCPGCFNPQSHAAAGGYERTPHEVACDIRAAAGTADYLEGVTFSGGEPLEQATGLLELLERLEEALPALGTVLFTGFSYKEIEAQPLRAASLEHIDATVCGRYVSAQHEGRGLIGSRNQELRLLTKRYSREDFQRVPRREAIVHAGGLVTYSGIQTPHARAT